MNDIYPFLSLLREKTFWSIMNANVAFIADK